MKPWIPLLFILLLALAALPVLGQTAVPVPDPVAPQLPVIALPPEALKAPALPGRPTAVSGKLDSALELVARSSTATDAAGVALARQLDVPVRGSRVQVDVVAADIAAAEADFTAAGGQVTGRTADGPRLQGWIAPSALRDLAGQPSINAIRVPLTAVPVDTSAGGSDTEGLGPINAPAWHTAGILGTGVKVAVIDIGFTGYPGLLGTDLPAQVTTRNFVDSSETSPVDNTSPHGTAVAEIIHDVAPQAQLYLLKINTDVDLEQAVNYAVAQGIDIISTSLIWYNATPGDGTGRFADLVNQARSQGILWVTAAGNDRERHWGGTFLDVDSDKFHEFAAGQEINWFGPGSGTLFLIPSGTAIRIYMRWNDWTAVNQDLDLYLYRYDSTSGQWQNVGAAGTNPQTGAPGQRPVEQIAYTTSGVSAPYGVLIHGKSVTRPVNIELFASRMPRFDELVTDRSLGNLADAPDAITVAAIDWISPFDQKDYSSEGPTNGPGGSGTGGLPKVDIAAYAGVSTETYGNLFGGTSAATPHVAGAAALVFSANPAFNATQLENFLLNAALDLGPGGYDNDYGYGRLYLGDAPATPTPTATATATATATPTATATVTATPTATIDPSITPSPTATGTPPPFSAYLPAISNLFP